ARSRWRSSARCPVDTRRRPNRESGARRGWRWWRPSAQCADGGRRRRPSRRGGPPTRGAGARPRWRVRAGRSCPDPPARSRAHARPGDRADHGYLAQPVERPRVVARAHRLGVEVAEEQRAPREPLPAVDDLVQCGHTAGAVLLGTELVDDEQLGPEAPPVALSGIAVALAPELAEALELDVAPRRPRERPARRDGLARAGRAAEQHHWPRRCEPLLHELEG